MRPSRTTMVALATGGAIGAVDQPQPGEGLDRRRLLRPQHRWPGRQREERPRAREGVGCFMRQQYMPCRRRRTFPIVLAGFTAFLDLYATQPLLPLLTRVFGATHVAVSLTVTASTVAVALAAPFVGRLADIVGRKRVIVGSAFVLAVRDGAGGDVRDARAADLLAVRPGALHARASSPSRSPTSTKSGRPRTSGARRPRTSAAR